MSSSASRVEVVNEALPPPLFRKLVRGVRALGSERMRTTYQTTFWYPFDGASCLPELAVDALAPRLRRSGVVGVEWWLSRMQTTNVQVDFHQDRDEKLALATGKLRHPLLSTVLFLNRVKGGLLAITDALPNSANVALAPDELDLDLVAPVPNRLAAFPGTHTHGVLDAQNQIPGKRLRGKGELRLTLIMNAWDRRPREVPRFAESRAYRGLVYPPG